jgi:hypothetical protein
MKAILSSETSILEEQHGVIPEDGILHSYRREHVKSNLISEVVPSAFYGCGMGSSRVGGHTCTVVVGCCCCCVKAEVVPLLN